MESQISLKKRRPARTEKQMHIQIVNFSLSGISEEDYLNQI